jgi:hypothetical protein
MKQQLPVRHHDREGDAGTRRVADIAWGLGWFSIALGAAELLAPRAVARVAGAKGNSGLVRAYGLREIACGIGILMGRTPAPFLWGRVVGDGLDIAALAGGDASTRKADSGRVATNLVTLAAITVLDVYTATSMSREPARSEDGTGQRRDYSTRRGFPDAPAAMRGAAMTDFVIPRDMATPKALQSYMRTRKP